MTALNLPTRNRTGGFTLISLLAVLVTVILLGGILLPALAKARLKSVQIRCAANLRQLGLAAQTYAQGDSRKLFPDCTGATWPWDLPGLMVNALLKNGAKREVFYCPGMPEQDNDTLWNFTAGEAGTGGYRVIGYAVAFRGAGRVRLTNVTESLAPAPYRIGNAEYQPPPSARVLSADATLSIGSNERDRTRNRYAEIYGGWSKPHRSPHLNGKIPAGGNLVFLDGHTEWKPFERMRVRTELEPPFWW